VSGIHFSPLFRWGYQRPLSLFDRETSLCDRCRRLLVKGKTPVLDLLTGKLFCDLLCYSLAKNLLEVIDVKGEQHEDQRNEIERNKTL
jgi:hypothetical protein